MANIEINIIKNGTTTLATAGKYCDSNIDVNVDVPNVIPEGYIKPSGSVEITANGTHDVTEYAEAVVAVPTETDVVDGILDGSVISIYNDRVTKLVANALRYRSSLVSLELPNLKTTNSHAFGYCSVLKYVKFQSATSLSNSSFNNCIALTTLILESETVCALGGTAVFTNTPIEDGTGYVYVPDELVDSYKTATNWTLVADQIKPISELGETA